MHMAGPTCLEEGIIRQFNLYYNLKLAMQAALERY